MSKPKDALADQGLLSDEQLQAIGLVAVESSKLESEIEFFTWMICGFDEESGRVLTDRLQLDGKLSLVRELTNIRIKSDQMRADFKDITDRISDLIPKRNTIIHGEWHGALGAILKQLPKAKSYPIAVRFKRDQRNIPIVPAGDVRAVADRLAHVRIQFLAFFLQNFEKLAPLRGKA